MKRPQTERNTVLVGAAFAIGVAAGFVLREAASGIYERARRARWHREYERTVVPGRRTTGLADHPQHQ